MMKKCKNVHYTYVLVTIVPIQEDEDESLLNLLLDTMQTIQADYTQTFRDIR